jgi:pyruvate dehydrogenase E2 component (dihydrolipoamide acetyltransferase)/2-oxoglutarate dehydrogenase E2 component (dihydrolipoamide succinyltransferase)
MPHETSGFAPLDVIMPALGMAQESGTIVAWHKQAGDAVAEGDVLFEVETDKATMEVEAQGSGFLTGVAAVDGEDVPVGQVIARITATAEDTAGTGSTGGSAPAPEPGPPDADAMPEGAPIIMPTLGMAQDSGLLVGWLVEPGARVAVDDPLFEVETDKSTVEVAAGADGYLAAQLAQPGEDVPTGQVIAIITAQPPAQTISRSAADGAIEAPAATSAPSEPARTRPEARSPAAPAKAAAAGPATPSGRILASPKARRLALEHGLDLSRLVAAGVPQPFHARDIETLKSLPAEKDAPAMAAATAAAGLHLTALVPRDGFAAFAAWAARDAGLPDSSALLAGLAGACLDHPAPVIACEAFGTRRLFRIAGPTLGAVQELAEPADEPADLTLRDLRATRISGLHLGPETAPVISLTLTGEGLSLTLEAAPRQLAPTAALSLLSDFAGRMEQPLRHLL